MCICDKYIYLFYYFVYFIYLFTLFFNQLRYKEAASHLSQVWQDQPQTPGERAVYWLEYVARHRGAPHLRSPGAALPWAHYLMLDLLLVLLLAALVLLFLLRCFLLLFRRMWGKSFTNQKAKRE